MKIKYNKKTAIFLPAEIHLSKLFQMPFLDVLNMSIIIFERKKSRNPLKVSGSESNHDKIQLMTFSQIVLSDQYLSFAPRYKQRQQVTIHQG